MQNIRFLCNIMEEYQKERSKLETCNQHKHSYENIQHLRLRMIIMLLSSPHSSGHGFLPLSQAILAISINFIILIFCFSEHLAFIPFTVRDLLRFDGRTSHALHFYIGISMNLVFTCTLNRFSLLANLLWPPLVTNHCKNV